MKHNTHHIRKVTLKMTLEKVSRQWTQYENALSEIKEGLPRAIGKVLDDYDVSRNYYLIDKINIDIKFEGRKFNAESFLKAFTEQFSRSVKENVSVLMADRVFKTKTGKINLEPNGIMEEHEYLFHQLKNVLLSGQWQPAISNTAEWDEAINAILQKHPTQIIEFLNQNHDLRIFERLVFQIRGEDFWLLIEKCFNKLFSHSFDIYSELSEFVRLLSMSLDYQNRVLNLYKIAVLEILTRHAFMSASEFMERSIDRMINLVKDDKDVMDRVNKNYEPSYFPVAVRMSRAMKKLFSGLVDLSAPLPGPRTLARDQNFQGKSSERHIEKPELKYYEKEEELEAKSHPFFCKNAGLVILYPYLPTLFIEFKLMKDNRFNDRASKITAMHMLSFLVWGQSKGGEGDMLLNKILCGYNPEAPVERFWILPPEFEEEAKKLLTATIEHWKKLKSTSVEGLRETFLQRDGKIEWKGKYWLLTVEKKPFDVLLQHLPWPISTVKLPWLKERIQVDWHW